jgi:hypothetical protein
MNALSKRSEYLNQSIICRGCNYRDPELHQLIIGGV